MSRKFQVKRGQSANLPTLAEGELGFTLDTGKLYVGNTNGNVEIARADHTHKYAGSSSAGGSATSAVKLDTSAGSATQPVYFSGGKPVKTTHTLGASVPSDAKFTDTTYSAATTSAAGLMSAADKSKLDNITASADAVSFAQTLTSGTKIGDITINGTTKSLYAPESGVSENHTHTLADVSDTTTKKAAYLVTASSTDGVAYTATVDGITALYTGLTITIIPNLQSTSRTPTLNVNGLGAKRMVMPINGSNTSATTQPPVVYSDETTEDEINSKTTVASKWLTANKPVTVRYDGTYWETDIVAQSASCLYGTVPIESGGTNAKTATEACTNLSALRYVAQTLTTAQKNQVRTNIGVTDDHINSLIDTKLGVIENGSY